MPSAESAALCESFREVMQEAATTAHEVERWQALDYRMGFESRAAFARMTKHKPKRAAVKRKAY